jgi:hypothetical protein
LLNQRRGGLERFQEKYAGKISHQPAVLHAAKIMFINNAESKHRLGIFASSNRKKDLTADDG